MSPEAYDLADDLLHGVIIIGCVALVAIAARWLLRRDEARHAAPAAPGESEHQHVIGSLCVPELVAADGRPITPADLHVFAVVVSRQAHHLAVRMTAEAMDAAVAQVADDEARRGLDDALARMTRWNR